MLFKNNAFLHKQLLISLIFIGLGLFWSHNTVEAKTQSGRTAKELENPYDWENAPEEESAPKVVPKLTPRVTAAPTPYQKSETDEKREKFYDRYFRKGKEVNKGDIPVTDEEKNSLIQQMIPHFTPTAERDSQKQQIQMLIHELAGEHHRRQTAIERLAMIGQPAVPALKKALQDPYKYKRIGALTTLGYIHPQGIVPAIQECLNDREPSVRQEAIKVIGRMKHRASAVVIEKCLHDDNERVRREAVIALGRMKGSLAEAALIKATRNPDSEIRRLACDELSFFDSESVLNALVDVTQTPDKDACLAAIKALGDIGNPAVRFELQKLSQSKDRMISQEAQQALSNLE